MGDKALNLDFYAPIFWIKVGGKEQKELKKAVISLDVEENLDKASMFTLNLNEGLDIKTQKFTWLDSKLLDPEEGEDVEIYIGYASRAKKSQEPLISGRITALNPSFPSTGIPTLSVQGYDHSFLLQKSAVNNKKKRTFDEEKDYGDIVKKIASKHNLGVGDIDSTIKPCKKIRQKENDYKFVEKISKRLGYEFFVRNKKLYFRKPRDNIEKEKEEDIITLKWRSELISFNPRLSTANVASKVTVKGHNQKNPGKPIIGIATLKDIEFKESGAKSAAEFVKGSMKEDVEISEHDFPVCDEENAKAFAKALLLKAINSLIEGRCECIGIPELRPGANVKIEGIGKRFSGKYYVKSVKHTIGGSGYTVSFEVRRGGIGTI